MRDSARDQGGGLEAAAKRLERAVGALESRLDGRLRRLQQLEAARGDGGSGDRAQLVAELEAARARERALEAIAAEASAALGRAAEEVRAALAEPAPANEDGARGEHEPVAAVYGEPVEATGLDATMTVEEDAVATLYGEAVAETGGDGISPDEPSEEAAVSEPEAAKG